MTDQATAMARLGDLLRNKVAEVGTKSGQDATLLRQEYRRVWAAKFIALRCEQDDAERLRMLLDWCRAPQNEFEQAWLNYIAPLAHTDSPGGMILDLGVMRFALVPIDKL